MRLIDGGHGMMNRDVVVSKYISFEWTGEAFRFTYREWLNIDLGNQLNKKKSTQCINNVDNLISNFKNRMACIYFHC